MTSSILHDPTFPHGTPEGLISGCGSSRCPAPIPCRDVHRRFAGDYTFRTRYLAGIPLAEIVEQDAREAEEARVAARAAARAAQKKQPARRKPATSSTRPVAVPLIPRAELRAMLDEGLTDRQIGERTGFTRRQVSGARSTAGYERNPAQRGTGRNSIDTLLPTVAHLELADAAKALGRSPDYVRRRRQIVAKLNRETPAESGVSSSQENA